MKFAFWSLIALIVWFFAGAGLSFSGSNKNAFLKMNDMLIIEWLLEEGLKTQPFLFGLPDYVYLEG